MSNRERTIELAKQYISKGDNSHLVGLDKFTIDPDGDFYAHSIMPAKACLDKNCYEWCWTSSGSQGYVGNVSSFEWFSEIDCNMIMTRDELFGKS